jgi:FixJ family two-component response regulator
MPNLDVLNGIVMSVVDDDPSVCEGLQDQLNSMGSIVTTFHGPDEFLMSDCLATAQCL